MDSLVQVQGVSKKKALSFSVLKIIPLNRATRGPKDGRG